MERRSTRAKKNVDPVTAVDGHTAVDQAKQPLNTVPSPSTTRRTQQASASRSKPIDSISGSASSTVHGTSAKLQAGDPTSVSAGATADANRPTATKKRRNASTSQSTSTKKPRSMKTSVDTASKTSPSTGEIAPPSKEQNSSDE